MIDIVEKNKCVGCKACGDICPVGAILYRIDEEGFWYPEINHEKCINCGLCKKVCPALCKFYPCLDMLKKPKSYKVYHKDRIIRYNSASGGLYHGIALAFLKKHGTIAGCVYNEDFSGAHHYMSDKEEDLDRIMGSKYFQSDTEGVFISMKSLLDKGGRVLFCGTPCQISALYGYLEKKYENLYTVDFICRGINSPLAFSSYMDELRRKYHSDIVDVHFKNKSRGWTNLGTLVRFQNGKVYYRGKDKDPWVNAFVVGNLYMRPCCASCQYKEFPRTADLTMGDFWGLKFTKNEKKFGVSVALVNTEKGRELLEDASGALDIEEREFEEVLNGNPALVQSAPLNPKRKLFFEKIKTEPYSKAVWSVLGSNVLTRKCSVVKNIMRRALHFLGIHYKA